MYKTFFYFYWSVIEFQYNHNAIRNMFVVFLCLKSLSRTTVIKKMNKYGNNEYVLMKTSLNKPLSCFLLYSLNLACQVTYFH